MAKRIEETVNSPAHYNMGDIECIDAIRAMLGPYHRYYLQGSVLKYLWRHPYKGKPVQDLEKGAWYLTKLIAEIEKEGPLGRSGAVREEELD